MNVHFVQYKLNRANLQLPLSEGQLKDAILLGFTQFLGWYPIDGLLEYEYINEFPDDNAEILINIYLDDKQLTVFHSDVEIQNILQEKIRHSSFELKGYKYENYRYIAYITIEDL